MRVVYMDESGISRNEPWVVVAGVIVHGDSKWKALEQELSQIVEDEIPPNLRDGFILHAKDLYHGSGQTPRKNDEWPLEKRWNILDRVVSLPQKLDLPLVFGLVEKDMFPLSDNARKAALDDNELSLAAHHVAFGACTMQAERWMRANTENEIAHLIAENNDQIRKAAKESQSFFQSPFQLAESGILSDEAASSVIPFERIVSTVHFAEKREDKLLQLADACAFCMKRRLQQSRDWERFFLPIKGQIAFPRIISHNENDLN